MLAAVGCRDLMFEQHQRISEQLADERLVVDAENAQRPGEGVGVGPAIATADTAPHREHQAEGRAFADFAFDLDGAFVAFHHAVNHRQPEAGATALRLG